MLEGKKVAGMDFANGSSVEFLTLGEETVASLGTKLESALKELAQLKEHLKNLEERVQDIENPAV